MAASQAGHIVARPPEMMAHGAVYDHRADVWSVGKTALLLARLLPLRDAISLSRADNLNFKAWDASFKSFVEQCLAPQDQRPHAEKLLEVTE